MSTARTVQTAFRFDSDLLQRIKNKARLQRKSLNRYVEDVISRSLLMDDDRYDVLYDELSEITLPEKISPDILALSDSGIRFSDDDLKCDERLAFLMGK